MPPLADPRREAFAWHLAEGAHRLQAYRQSGFSDATKNAARTARRIATRATMVARVDEIRRAMDWAQTANAASVINELAWLIRKARMLESAAALVAAKGMLSEVVRLKGKLDDPGPEPADAEPVAPPMSKAEWIATYAAKG